MTWIRFISSIVLNHCVRWDRNPARKKKLAGNAMFLIIGLQLGRHRRAMLRALLDTLYFPLFPLPWPLPAMCFFSVEVIFRAFSWLNWRNNHSTRYANLSKNLCIFTKSGDVLHVKSNWITFLLQIWTTNSWFVKHTCRPLNYKWLIEIDIPSVVQPICYSSF